MGERLKLRFLAHRSVTLELATRIPDDRGDFRPWSEAMTVAALLRHMAQSHHTFSRVAAGEQPTPPPTDPATLEEARKRLAEYTTQDAEILAGLTREALQRTVTFHDRSFQVREAVSLGLEHEVHHKGQLFVYARMLGVDVPSWREYLFGDLRGGGVR